MACRTCKHLNIPPDKDGKIRIRKGSYRCDCPMPPPPVMPACIRVHVGRKGSSYGSFIWPEPGHWMDVEAGTDCAFHEPRA